MQSARNDEWFGAQAARLFTYIVLFSLSLIIISFYSPIWPPWDSIPKDNLAKPDHGYGNEVQCKTLNHRIMLLPVLLILHLPDISARKKHHPIRAPAITDGNCWLIGNHKSDFLVADRFCFTNKHESHQHRPSSYIVEFKTKLVRYNACCNPSL